MFLHSHRAKCRQVRRVHDHTTAVSGASSLPQSHKKKRQITTTRYVQVNYLEVKAQVSSTTVSASLCVSQALSNDIGDIQVRKVPPKYPFHVTLMLVWFFLLRTSWGSERASAVGYNQLAIVYQSTTPNTFPYQMIVLMCKSFIPYLLPSM